MSSLVQAKCTNSPRRLQFGVASKRAFSQYSTALTSWLVVLLDVLDGLRVGFAEAQHQPAQQRRARPRTAA